MTKNGAAMRITDAHRRYWNARRGPEWSREPLDQGAIHACINGHDPRYRQFPYRSGTEAHNTLALLRRNRATTVELVRYLDYLAKSPHSSPRRKGYARRWLRKVG